MTQHNCESWRAEGAGCRECNPIALALSADEVQGTLWRLLKEYGRHKGLCRWQRCGKCNQGQYADIHAHGMCEFVSAGCTCGFGVFLASWEPMTDAEKAHVQSVAQRIMDTRKAADAVARGSAS